MSSDCTDVKKKIIDGCTNIVHVNYKKKRRNLKMKEKQFYCVKCRDKVTIRANKDIRVAELRNGRFALKSKCHKCGTKLSKFISQKNVSKMIKKYGI